MAKEEEIMEMLRQHISDSNTFREEMKASVIKIETHGEYTKKAVEKHDADIDSLKTTRTRQNGALWAFGIVWSGILAILALFKN